MSNNLAVREYTGFELYLEGTKIPSFNNITIRESEGLFPQASISFPATSGILKTLPGTIVQVFGPDPKTQYEKTGDQVTESNKKILLFEGEITSQSYNKNAQGKTISFECRSFLYQWQTATATPKDSIMTPEWRSASGQDRKDYFNFTQGDKPTQETNSTFGTVETALRKRLGTEVYDRLNNMMDEIQLTQAGQFSDELTQVLDTDEVTAGDVYYLIAFFLKKFELHDPYYGVLANSINLAESVSTWPNKDKIGPFKLKAVLENFFRFTQSVDGMQEGSLNLMHGLKKILATIHYTIVAPSNFTNSFQFWNKNLESDENGNIKRKPVRAYFMPNLEQSPPAKFNTIFPHQIQNLSYSRSMVSEPTRTIGTSRSNFPVQSSIPQFKGVSPFCTEPLLNITQEGIENNKVGLTPEETYRGITLNRASFSTYFTEVAEKMNSEEYEGEDLTQEEYKEKIQQPLNQMTIDRHYQKRLSNRTVNVGVAWSPYRMTGVPGTIIQGDDLPSVTGVIASITTNISGAGRVQSTLTFRSSRLIHQKEDFEHPDYESMINDYTLDPYVNSNPYLFDPEEYDFEEIGYDLYNFLGAGTLSNDTPLIEYSKLEEGGVFTEAQSNIENIEKISGEGSILGIIRNEDGKLPDLETDGEFERSAKLTFNVHQAVHTLEDIYSNIEDGDALEKWSNTFTYRNLVDKGSYFSSIGIDPSQPINRDENYKDGIKIFSGTALDLKAKNYLKESLYKKGTEEATTHQERLGRLDVIQDSIDDAEAEIERLQNISDVDGTDFSDKMSIYEKINYLQDKLDKGYTDKDTGEKMDGLRQQKQDLLSKMKLSFYESNSDSEGIRGFENELFKVYNITRRAHVRIGFHKYIQQNLSGSSNAAINENLNITT